MRQRRRHNASFPPLELSQVVLVAPKAAVEPFTTHHSARAKPYLFHINAAVELADWLPHAVSPADTLHLCVPES